jgi:hypothetical protein
MWKIAGRQKFNRKKKKKGHTKVAHRTSMYLAADELKSTVLRVTACRMRFPS